MVDYFSLIWTTVAPELGNHLWQSTLFALIAWLLTLLCRRNQAQTRYWLWLAASLKFLLPFSLLIKLGSRLAGPRLMTQTRSVFYWTIEQVSRPFPQKPLSAVPPVPAASSPAYVSWLPMLAAVLWLAGLIVVLGLWCLCWLQLSRVLREAKLITEGREVEALRRLLNGSGRKGPIRMLLSSSSLEPGIFGIFHPVLLWPQGISQRLEDEHLEAILAHEVWHVRRRDNLAAAIHMIVEAIFWFHPLVWWLGARLVEERERACDEAVLALGNRPQIYAESILKTCEFCLEAPLACVSGVTGADLKRRVSLIMTEHLSPKLTFAKKLLLASVGAAAIAGPFVFGALHVPEIRAQSPTAATSTSLSFEVASIKPNRSNDGLTRFMFSPDGITAEAVTVKTLIGFAYNLKDFQLSGGPDWLDSEKFDVKTRMDEATIETLKKLPTQQRMEPQRQMLQSLLAERFKLQVSRSSKEMPIYVLLVAKGGPKFSQSAPAAVGMGHFEASSGKITLTSMKITGFAEWLARVLGRTVLDKTGLEGNYDLELSWTPDPRQQVSPFTPMPWPANGDAGTSSSDSSGPTIFTALQEQLGLKLESGKGPVETLRIDSIEKPSED